ncbi:hypothetical protein CF326_g4060 [Tilletia indica]|nr:hypothetical protein CF326_g4060 [Tilletia indica]
MLTFIKFAPLDPLLKSFDFLLHPRLSQSNIIDNALLGPGVGSDDEARIQLWGNSPSIFSSCFDRGIYLNHQLLDSAPLILRRGDILAFTRRRHDLKSAVRFRVDMDTLSLACGEELELDMVRRDQHEYSFPLPIHHYLLFRSSVFGSASITEAYTLSLGGACASEPSSSRHSFLTIGGQFPIRSTNSFNYGFDMPHPHQLHKYFGTHFSILFLIIAAVSQLLFILARFASTGFFHFGIHFSIEYQDLFLLRFHYIDTPYSVRYHLSTITVSIYSVAPQLSNLGTHIFTPARVNAFATAACVSAGRPIRRARAGASFEILSIFYAGNIISVHVSIIALHRSFCDSIHLPVVVS